MQVTSCPTVLFNYCYQGKGVQNKYLHFCYILIGQPLYSTSYLHIFLIIDRKKYCYVLSSSIHFESPHAVFVPINAANPCGFAINIRPITNYIVCSLCMNTHIFLKASALRAHCTSSIAAREKSRAERKGGVDGATVKKG